MVNIGQIYTSTDSGVNWTARESNRSWRSVASSSDGSKLVASVANGQIYTSTNSGVNWTARESNRNWLSVASSADGSKLVVGVANGQIYTSTDSGVNWTARESNRNWRSVASSSDGSKLVAVVINGQIYTSTDSGVNWTVRESTRFWQSVASSADGSKLVAVVFTGQIYTSTDSGVNWTVRESDRNWNSVASSSDGSKLVAVGNVGQIYTSIPARAGGQGSSVELQYAGGGVWQPLNLEQSALNVPNTIVTRDASGSIGAANITANGSITAPAFSWSSGSSLIDSQGGSMELGNSLLTGATPFIDFHYGTGVGQDYNVRLINDANGRLTVGGSLWTTGTLGVGRVPTTNQLEVEGNASKTTATAWLANSDARIKLGIRPIEHALETIERVRPVVFRYTDEYRSAHPSVEDRDYWNVIAQEFREVFPDAVRGSGERLADGSEILQVDTYPATITALAAIKELSAKLREKDAELAELKKQLNARDSAVEARLAALEAAAASAPVKVVLKK